MRIDGLWYVCDDAVLRPVIWAKIHGADQRWHDVPFLVDTGADRTVICAAALELLGLTPGGAAGQLAGVGGAVNAVVVETAIEVRDSAGAPVVFRGQFNAFTDPEALDMSVVGRNLLNLFAVIVDRPREVVCLLGQGHDYDVVKR